MTKPALLDGFGIDGFIQGWAQSLPVTGSLLPWAITDRAPGLIGAMIGALGDRFTVNGDVAIHNSATVEAGAVLKGPAILGPNVFVAANAYLRGGVYLGKGCIVGPCCELKTVFMFPGSKVAHLSFVGDSLIGSRVNIEAGAIVANYRNEREDKEIHVRWDGRLAATGVRKFGALIGDDARIGANAVIAPGTLIEPRTRIGRLELVDQS